MKSTIYLVLILSLAIIVSPWCEKTHFAQTSQINQVDISPDQTMVITSSNSKKMIVWNFTNLHPIRTLTHSQNVMSSKFSKNQKYIAIGLSSTSTVNILLSATFASVKNISTGVSSVMEVDFSWDNSRLMVCGSNTVQIYWVVNWTLEIAIPNGSDKVLTCKFQKNNKYGFGDDNGKTRLYSSVINTIEWSDSQGSQVLCIDFDTVNYTLISTNSNGNKFYLYPSARWPTGGGTSQTVIKTTTLTNTPKTVAYAKEGSIYAIGTSNNLLIYQNSTNNLLFNWTGAGSINAGVFSYNSQYFISGSTSGLLKVFKRNCMSCPVGTYQNSTSCLLCGLPMPGCLNCLNSTFCFQCGDGFALNTTNNNCTLCQSAIAGCVLCNSTSICTACSSLYYLTANSCSLCSSIPNCLTCYNSSSCLKCSAGFYLDSSLKCSNCLIYNCLNCINSTSCLSCSTGYYLSGGTCTRCQNNCTQCYNSTSCSQCKQSNYLSTSNICLTCSPNCLVCNSSTICINCVISYYLSGNSCSPCPGSCFACANTTTCYACISGYYLNGGSCSACTGNCVTCTNATTCLSCNVNYYYLYASNSCNKCQNLIQGCLQCTNTTCLSCQKGFYFDGTNCIRCLQYGCQTCQNATFCASCITGYQYNSSTGVCSTCGLGCSNCINSTVCLNCMPKFYLSSGACTLCPYNCPTCLNATYCLFCIEGYFMNTTQNCQACTVIANCATCTSNAYCISCELGYSLNAAKTSCVKCVWPCSICNSTICYECAVGYYINSGTCPICPTGCSSCINSTICASCVNGYYLSSSYSCLACQSLSNGCEICNNTSCSNCLTKLGYYLNPSTLLCDSCTIISNCLQCTNSSICTLCSYGYYVSTSACSLCANLVSNCQHCSSTVCLTCMDPFYLTASGCQLCNEGCSSCYNSSTCKQCSKGYLMQTASCTFCNTLLKGCSICTSTTVCSECTEGYILSGTSCTSCNAAMAGCLFCNGTNFCLSCIDQYYLSNTNVCTKCDSSITGCSQCNSSAICLACQYGYYLNSNTCTKCNDVMCLQCSNSSNCFNCLSGYFSNSTGNCQLCNSLIQGCVLCNSSVCLQCVSGYYLNSTKQCSQCLVNGCEICNSLNSTQCVTCSSLYYLSSSNNCISCTLAMQGCLNCVSSAYCTKCASGYYLAANFTCGLCYNQFKGCRECTAVACNYCEGGYIMNVSSCATCISFIAGCQYCISSTVCLTCQSGYYQSSNSCLSCTNITGCLDCSTSSKCNLCSDSYYLNSADNLCYLCSSALSGCVTCSSSTTCRLCLGDYGLSGGVCSIIKSDTTQKYTELRLVTQYINASCLLHKLIVKGSSYKQAAINLTQSTTIAMVSPNGSITLTILSFLWPNNNYQIYFYTNNPLGSNFNSIYKSMPSMRLLASPEQEHSRLLATNIDLNYQFKLDMTQSSIQAILPSSTHTGSLSLNSLADSPTFIRSIYAQKQYNYHYMGLILTIFIFIIYFIKAAVTVPMSDDQGQLISHIFALKCGGVIFSLVYMEYMDYCYGFLSADLPWLNPLTSILSNDSDLSPNSYLLFYSNMTLANTYLSALVLITTILLVFLFIAWFSPQKRESLKIVGMFFYNFFEVGLVMVGSESIQGAYYNNLNYITSNSIFYIFGILIYLIVGIVNLWMVASNIQRINKIRTFTKITFLSLLYLSPIYLLPIAIGIELVFIFFEFQIKKAVKLHPHIWVVNQLIVNLSFVFLVLFANSLISIFASFILVLLAVCIDLYIHIRQFKHQDEIGKVKEVQQLTAMLENQEKMNQSIKRKNNSIYKNTSKDLTSSNSFTRTNFNKEFSSTHINSEDDYHFTKTGASFTIEDELKFSPN